MQYGILGPLDVREDDGSPVAVPPGMPRRLLSLLLVEPGAVVPAARLIDAMWPSCPPASAENLVQGYVSKLRRALGPTCVETSTVGYRLDADPAAVDAQRFLRLLDDGQPRRALELWRGDPLPDLPGHGAAEALQERRLTAIEDTLDRDLAAGRFSAVASTAEPLTRQHPYRERLWANLIHGLRGSGRQADALSAYGRARAILIDELGIEPGPVLRAAHQAALENRPTATGPIVELPASTTALIGRGCELAEVATALISARIVTIAGPGGAGKTKLAIEAARRAADRSPDGVWFVDLIPITTEGEVPSTLADTIGVRYSASPLDAVIAYLKDRTALIVFDNCEHLIGAAADTVSNLAAGCSQLRILVTSREQLDVEGERIIVLGGLADSDAAELFRTRAAATGRPAPLDHLHDIKAICTAVDGLPLAIELAAASLAGRSLEELAASPISSLLDGVQRRGTSRHRSLHALIEWSFSLLDANDIAGVQALTVFAGPFDREAADAVVAGRNLGLIDRLVRRSLLARQPDAAGRAWFRLLVTVRAFAESSAEPSVLEAARRRHFEYYLAVTDAVSTGVRTGGSAQWMTWLRPARENFRGAVEYAFTSNVPPEQRGRIVASLFWPWFLDGRLAELRDWLTKALELEPELDAELRARLWWGMATTSVALGNFETASQASDKGVAAADLIGFELVASVSRAIAGIAAWAGGDHPRAMRILTDARNRATRSRDRWMRAVVGALAGRTLAAVGDPTARDVLEEAETIASDLGEPMALALCHDYLGSIAVADGNLEVAAKLASDSLTQYRAVGYEEGAASALALSATVACLQKNWPTAEHSFTESLELCRRIGHRGGIATSLDGLGIVCAHTGRLARAAELLDAAAGERAAIGVVLAPNLVALHQTAVALVSK